MGLICLAAFISEIFDVVQIYGKHWKSLVKNWHQVIPKLILSLLISWQMTFTSILELLKQDKG